MDQPSFFQAADDLNGPAGDRLDPFRKEPRIITVAQSAGRNHARSLHRIALDGAMKAAQDFERMRHGLGIKISVAEDAFSQTGNLSVLMQCNQPTAAQLGYAEPDRVGADIDGGKDRHGLYQAWRARLRTDWAARGGCRAAVTTPEENSLFTAEMADA